MDNLIFTMPDKTHVAETLRLIMPLKPPKKIDINQCESYWKPFMLVASPSVSSATYPVYYWLGIKIAEFTGATGFYPIIIYIPNQVIDWNNMDKLTYYRGPYSDHNFKSRSDLDNLIANQEKIYLGYAIGSKTQNYEKIESFWPETDKKDESNKFGKKLTSLGEFTRNPEYAENIYIKYESKITLHNLQTEDKNFDELYTQLCIIMKEYCAAYGEYINFTGLDWAGITYKGPSYTIFESKNEKIEPPIDAEPSSSITLEETDPEKREEENVEIYSKNNIRDEGAFLDEETIQNLIDRLKEKKNLILQGPPGTGKTWLAKRLAYAVAGNKEEAIKHMRSVQFHSGITYEDFVCGWRPTAKGILEQVNGPFLEIIEKAKQDPHHPYFLIIEEINRGNPAQIFGELLTLVEASKRCKPEDKDKISQDGLQLTYKMANNEICYVPENIYIIGTMNLADRSLAIVDFAFRRRFAFVTLKPEFNETWKKWVKNKGVPEELAKKIYTRLKELNDVISESEFLGDGFMIGHSFFTPEQQIPEGEAQKWYDNVINQEVVPILREYFFDDKDELKKQENNLKGIPDNSE